jgi:endonuclease/exonuclease/phosphatase family protein
MIRIIEWNCQGAFRLKNRYILDLCPDILIVAECEKEHILQFGKLTPPPNDFIWYGDSNKGIAIFSYSGFKLRRLKEFNPNFRYIIPIEVYDDARSFLLFAVWAKDDRRNPLVSYIGQVWGAINYYQTILQENSILMGDFNSNRIWDGKERIGNHSDVVCFLKRFGIESLYHKQHNEEQGQEKLNTFFMHRNISKPYHIDYVFASDRITRNGYNLTLGTPQDWIDKSDHIPLILDINAFESKLNFENTFYDFVMRHLQRLTNITQTRYNEEILQLKDYALNLDTKEYDVDKAFALIDKIETLKQIDQLSGKFIDRGLH